MINPYPKQRMAASNCGLHKERPDPPDKQVVREVLAGNKDRFDILDNRYRDAVKRYLCRVIFDKSEVEGLCQLTLDRAYRHLHTFKQDLAFLPWLMTITRNVARSYMRKVKRERKCLTMLSLDALQGTAEEPSCPGPAGERHQQRLNAMRLALAGLPDYVQVTLVKHIGERVPYGEITKETGRNPRTLASDVHRALPTLKKQIQLKC